MEKYEEYYLLGKQMEQIKKRREKLREQILHDRPQAEGWKIEVQLRRRQKLNHVALEQLVYDKGLWEECTIRAVDHSLVEQAYLEGKLTDSDMRLIDDGGSYTEALIVDKVGEEEDVQTSDDSAGEWSGDGTLHDWPHSEATEEVSRDD